MKISFQHVKRTTSSFLRARVYHQSRRVECYICTCPSWDPEKKRSGDPYVDARVATIEALFNAYIVQTAKPSFEDVKKIIEGRPVTQTVNTLLTDLFTEYVRDRKNNLSPKTIKRYQLMRREILDFEKTTRQKLYLEDINKDFYNSYISYCVNQMNANITINRKVKTIKTIMAFAVEEGFHNAMTWKRRTHLKETKAARVPLNEEERKKFWKLTTPDLMARRVIDAFLFSMYTGLRFQDLAKLSSHHIHFEEYNGKKIAYINMTAVKGLTVETIPVIDIIMPILERYLSVGERFFNLPDNARANQILKAAAKHAKLERNIEQVVTSGSKVTTNMVPLWKMISYHFARYTFAEIQERAGLPVSYIQRNMNHAKIETTNGYMRTDVLNRVIETRKKLAK